MNKPLEDHERSAFGLGWETNRRGESIGSSPYADTDWRWEEFRDGWFQHRNTAAKRHLKENV